MNRTVVVVLPDGVGIKLHLDRKPSQLNCLTLMNRAECYFNYGSGSEICTLHATVHRLKDDEQVTDYLSSRQAVRPFRERIQYLEVPHLGRGESVLLYRNDPCGSGLIFHRLFVFSNKGLGVRFILQIMGQEGGLAGSNSWIQSLLLQVEWVSLESGRGKPS